MAGLHIRGVLVEYTGKVLGPLPNIVVFQFNPEQLSRSLNFVPRTSSTQSTPRTLEPRQTSAPPSETFSITAHFSVADDLGGGPAAPIARLHGVGPQLAALERMAYPPGGLVSGASVASVDQVGDTVSSTTATSASGGGARAQVPREPLPKLLFIWGRAKVLPVQVQSMSITEQKYDALLNPVQAQVEIGLGVISMPASPKQRAQDPIAVGALEYTQSVKDAQAELNLAKVAEFAADIITF